MIGSGYWIGLEGKCCQLKCSVSANPDSDTLSLTFPLQVLVWPSSFKDVKLTWCFPSQTASFSCFSFTVLFAISFVFEF